jgi:PAS domain S-box-containing protein
MTAGKKKPEEKKPDTPPGERSLRDSAEQQLARSPKPSSEMKGKTSEQFIYELQVHQIELETQAEELRRAHLALEESRDKFLDLYDFAPTGYLTLTDKVLIAEVNLAGATLLGVERSKLVNTRFRKYIAPEFFEQWDQYFVNVLNRGEKQTCTLTLKRSDGSTVPSRMEGVRITGRDGANSVRIAISDISDIWQIEALKETNDYLNNLFDYANAPIIVWDSKYVITRFNHAFEDMTLRSEQEVKGQRLDILFPKESKEISLLKIKKTLEGERWETVEIPILVKDGSVRTVLWNSANILDPDGRIISTIAQGVDITERKVTEEVLRQSEEKYRQLVDLAQEGIWAINAEGTTSYVNPRMAEMLGYTVEEMHGRHLFSFMDDAGKTIAAENMERRRQGIKEEHEFEFITKEGDRIYTALATAPITDDDGVYKGALAVVSDITERKRAKDALLRVNQKLNVLSQLTRKDLTCQIFVLNSYLEITKKNAAGQDHILEGIQKCEKAILSISEITEFTKDFQDMGAKPPKWQNVKMALLFGLSHISIINIQHSLETENLEIFADPLLEKVCQRLFENSVKHGGHVSLIRVSHTITPDSVTIVFEDDGVGISAEKKEQIFLRGEGPRASMRSLFFVREILDITGIIIKETGEPGKGARFEITVPKGAWRTAGGDN